MGEVLAVRDAYRAQEWAMLIQECSASGMTKREFCQQRGISEKSFYYWIRKLRDQAVQSSCPQLVQLEPGPAAEDMLRIQYRGAELNLPAGVLQQAVFAGEEVCQPEMNTEKNTARTRSYRFWRSISAG